jgi:hypothetical protein
VGVPLEVLDLASGKATPLRRDSVSKPTALREDTVGCVSHGQVNGATDLYRTFNLVRLARSGEGSQA